MTASMSVAYGKFLHEPIQNDARSNPTKFEVLTLSENALF